MPCARMAAIASMAPGISAECSGIFSTCSGMKRS